VFVCNIAKASFIIDRKYPTKHHKNMLTKTKPSNIEAMKHEQNIKNGRKRNLHRNMII
jgi:hypothetical protein